MILSLLHFYWAFGGRWAIEATIPEPMKETFFSESNKTKMMLATLVVAFGLLAFFIVTLSNYYIEIEFLKKYNLTSKLMLAIGIIFSLRAIGDFNIVGLFKKQTGSVFAINDNRIYTPICIYLGVTCILISLLS